LTKQEVMGLLPKGKYCALFSEVAMSFLHKMFLHFTLENGRVTRCEMKNFVVKSFRCEYIRGKIKIMEIAAFNKRLL
jgi:hypothetical protein